MHEKFSIFFPFIVKTRQNFFLTIFNNKSKTTLSAHFFSIQRRVNIKKILALNSRASAISLNAKCGSFPILYITLNNNDILLFHTSNDMNNKNMTYESHAEENVRSSL
jgi:hypothetical protein